MEEIVNSSLVEFDKSAFLIELMKHDSGKLYLSVTQTIHDEEIEGKEKTRVKRIIKINPSILSDLVRILNAYHKLIHDDHLKSANATAIRVRERTFTESEKKAIQERYLKGVPIADLTLQFNCKAELIEQVLRNNNIVIVKGNPTKPSRKYSRKKRK